MLQPVRPADILGESKKLAPKRVGSHIFISLERAKFLVSETEPKKS